MAQHTYEQMTRDNCVEIAHYAREIARMIDAGEPLQPWMSDLIAKCRSSIGEVKHRMETRSGAIGAPVGTMGVPGLSGSARVAKMRAKNAAHVDHGGKNPYHRYRRKRAVTKK